MGAGPAGMATAVALQRAGWTNVLLLERRTKEECMQGGTALGLWTNAFRALDALGGGVTAAVRERSSRTTAVEICREKNDRVLTSFDLTSCVGGPHEFGGVLRGELVGALYDAVDAGCVDVRFGTAVASVRGVEKTATVAVTTDAGEAFAANVVVGADGVNSVVARAYGAANDKDMSTNDAGQVAIRGIAAFPPGDDAGATVAGGPIRQVLGAGVRAGMYPVGPAERNELYWYVCYPSGSTREGSDVLEEARRVLLESNEDWRTSRIFDAIGRTDPSRVSRNRLADRWDVDALFSRSSGGSGGMSIALTGDALHPMTPNLGQGGCCALEDAVLLAAYLPGPEAKGAAVQHAIAAYTAKRARRCVKLTVRARAMGEILQSGVGAVVLARDLFLERGFRAGGFLDHAAYDVRKDARGEGGSV